MNPQRNLGGSVDFIPSLLTVDAESVRLPLLMLVVFGSAKLLEELFERFGQPGIAGQILAGILIGPSVLGWITPNSFLTELAELGVMFLLFRVGLEIKSSELMSIGATALLVAVLGIAVPFLTGAGILWLWGAPKIETIFVGTAMVATSVGITAQLLAAKGLLHSAASKLILAAAVIDDVLGLLILAVVTSLAKGPVNIIELAATAALAIGFTMIVAKWGTRAAAPIIHRSQEILAAAESQFAVALLLLFGLAVLAVYAGVAAIIGAFLAGMALSESGTHRVQDLTQGVTEFLVPFFLAGIGLQFNLAAFSNRSTLWLSIAILAAAIVSKFIGCGLGALKLGRSHAACVGAGMIPRGEVGMVVAQIGLSMGVIEQNIFGVVVFMSVMTTVAAPPLLKLAYRHANRQN
jgi:Kef-type K+ transport system membrane component KefB